MRCLPFFHPTRVAFVDDDRSFLNLFPLRLDAGVPFLRYNCPHTLLEDLEGGRIETRIDVDWWTYYSGASGDPSPKLMGLDKSRIFQHIFDEDRFDVLSVVVMDYEMPEMTGIELCREIAGEPCRKILLTGQADQSLAIHAFNEGLIDLYLPKRHPGLEAELNHAIRRFQVEYMAKATDMLRQALISEDPDTWEDEGFCSLFDQIRRDRGVVEYYAVDDPKGFLMVDAAAQGALLLVFDDREVEAQRASATASRAPSGVVAQLQSRRSVLHFRDDEGYQVLTERQWWNACTPLHPFPGRTDRWYAVVDQPDPYPVTPETVLGLERYLTFMDRA